MIGFIGYESTGLNWRRKAKPRNISTVLTDGVMLEGKVVAVRPEVLVVEVKKPSAPARFRGTADIPRELVSIGHDQKPERVSHARRNYEPN